MIRHNRKATVRAIAATAILFVLLLPVFAVLSFFGGNRG